MLSYFNCQMDEEGICVCNDAFLDCSPKRSWNRQVVIKEELGGKCPGAVG